MPNTVIDSSAFRKILTRNVALPLVASILFCAVYIGLLLNLLDATRSVTESNQIIGKANEVIKLMVDSETGVRGFLISGKDTYLEPHLRTTHLIIPGVRELVEFVKDEPSQVARLSQFEKKYKLWNTLASQIIEQKRAGTYRIGEGSDERKALMDSIRTEFDVFLKTAEHIRDEKVTATTERTYMILLLTVAFSLIVGFLLAIMGRKQLIGLATNYEETLKTQTNLNEKLLRQSWVKSCLTQLAERIQGELTTQEVAERALDQIVPYVDSTVGTLYGLDESGSFARLGGYAFSDEAANIPSRFKFGEGLIGQTALNKKILILDSIPEDYIKVKSGLGDAKPRVLAIIPLATEGSIQGVLELAFTRAIDTKTMELLEQLSEILAGAIRSAAYRLRLQNLLNESQQLTEELQTQQEELRVSNEELSERSKALQNAQSRLESQHAELEQINVQLEKQAQVLEHQNQDLKLTRTELIQKAHEIESGSKYKSEFLANMSHELRTPLNSTLILAKLLKDNSQGNLTTEQVEFATTIYSAGNDLLNLINDILDLSKVEAGKLEIQSDKISIQNLVNNLHGIFKPLAQEKKLDLKVSVSTDAPPFIETDPQRLDQILKNLLSNAIKFTSAGFVELRIESAPDNTIVFKVKDTGVGIAPEQHDVIFEAFRQADGTTNRKFGGTGLGLSISKNLATLLGGSIKVESDLNKGSTFTLALPVQYQGRSTSVTPPAPFHAPESLAPKAAPAELIGEAPFPDDRENHQLDKNNRQLLLVVEDELKFAKILYDLAHELHFSCIVTDNTSDGFKLASKFLPEAIILDIKLPDGSGLSLLDRLKSNSKTRHIPVHVISASQEFSREALHLGAVGYDFKPTDRETLKKTLLNLEKKISQQLKKVLVVEDDPTQRKSIERLIHEKGVEIISVGSGMEAIKNLNKFTFDCMIIDLSLPDMSGFELLESLSEKSEISFPPVIVYTGRALSRAEEERLRRYSKTIIIKGARSPERLLDEVTLFLHQVESSLSPEHQKILKDSRYKEKSFEGRKILLVDDDVRNIFALTSALEQKGARIIIARNGREALDQLAQQEDVDLVLMDVMMPEMDGYEAMREIRKQKKFIKLPIIAVTAKAMKDDYERCRKAGANDYLAKPVDLDKLISLIRVWLSSDIGTI